MNTKNVSQNTKFFWVKLDEIAVKYISINR